MCGFLYASFDIEEELLKNSESMVQKRGPDYTNHAKIDGETFAHYLLHITGERTPQPLELGESYLVYNGEVYNYNKFGTFKSDGYAILEAYDAEGIEGLQQLDGEFSGIIRTNTELVMFRDTFGTKPMFMAWDERGIAVSSYTSQLKHLGFSNITTVPLNQITVLNMKTKQVTQDPYRVFNLSQHKNHFDDWEQAFSSAIEKRTNNSQVSYFIGLSSGYDSGLISCFLNEFEVDYKSYSILAAENYEVLKARGLLAPHNEFIHLTQAQYEGQKAFLENNCEPFTTPPRQTRANGYSVLKDKGAVGTGIVCEKAKTAGCKVYMSGQGSDEILSDYGHAGRVAPGFLHSTIGGYFPDDLAKVYPWENFYGGTQEEFLAKDENVGGTYGLECRYPFLDFAVVQEFLWLKNELKNSHYKSPIHHVLTKRGYPMAPNGLFSKVGFRANSGFRT
jgi:asparagine synthetase B (glutamine-hydrolysing)